MIARAYCGIVSAPFQSVADSWHLLGKAGFSTATNCIAAEITAKYRAARLHDVSITKDVVSMSISQNLSISRRGGRSLSLAALGAAMAFAASPAAAATSGTATANVNLRAGPGTSYPVVITLPQSAPLTVYGCTSSTSWCDVSWGVERGWVAANYIYVSYQGEPTVVTASVVPVVGITAVAFSVAYWDSHYRHHHWYHDWDDYSRKTVAGCNGDGCGAASVTRGPHGGGRAAAVGCNDNGCAAGSATRGPRGAGRAAVGGCTDEKCGGAVVRQGPRGNTAIRHGSFDRP